MFLFTFYSNFHASVTLLFVWIFMKFSPKCRSKKLGLIYTNFGKLLLIFSLFVCLFVFVALRPKSTAMVIEGRSVHLTTLFSWASLNKQFTSNPAHTFACN